MVDDKTQGRASGDESSEAATHPVSSTPPPGSGRRQRRAAERDRDEHLGHIETFDDAPARRSTGGFWSHWGRRKTTSVVDVDAVGLRSTSIFAGADAASQPDLSDDPATRETLARAAQTLLDARLAARTRALREQQSRVQAAPAVVEPGVVESVAEPEVLEPPVEPEVRRGRRARLDAEPDIQPDAEPETAPVAEPEAEPAAEPVTAPVVEPIVEPVLEPVSEPVAEPVLEPVSEPVAEPVAEPAPEPVTEPVLEPIAARTATEPAAPPSAQPTTGSMYREHIAYGSLPLRPQMLQLLRAANEAGQAAEVDTLVPATRKLSGLVEQFHSRRSAATPSTTAANATNAALAETLLPSSRRARIKLEQEIERAHSASVISDVELRDESQPLGRRERRISATETDDAATSQVTALQRAADAERAARRRQAATPTVRRRFEFGRTLVELTAVLVVGLLLAMGTKAFLVESFNIPSQSMENTLAIGDRIVVTKFTPRFFDLKRGDVVVFQEVNGWAAHAANMFPTAGKAPEAPKNAFQKAVTFLGTKVGILPETDETFVIKRVIGLPGDTIQCCTDKGETVVNGAPMVETFLKPGTVTDARRFSVTVKPGHIWVEGDNRGESFDSRYNLDWKGGGQVAISNVVGLAKWVIFPQDHFGSIDVHSDIFEQVPPAGTAPKPGVVLDTTPRASETVVTGNYIPPTGDVVVTPAPTPTVSQTAIVTAPPTEVTMKPEFVPGPGEAISPSAPAPTPTPTLGTASVPSG